MIDLEACLAAMANAGMDNLADDFRRAIEQGFNNARHGDLPQWLDAIASLPRIRPSVLRIDSDTVTIGSNSEVDPATRTVIERSLRNLMPWRKGPFDFFGLTIDAEWRSDRKWNRLVPHIANLEGRRVLDVGCGNGYYLWRMRGRGARFVVGIDPTILYLIQFLAAQHFIADSCVQLLPMRDQDLPAGMELFDTVFSMGVLYHHRDPHKHLARMRDALRPEGQLILESLVVEGGDGDVLLPQTRYAQMRNVWQIPSVQTLSAWLRFAKFRDIQVISVDTTIPEEQRATDWMRFQSLADFLDPTDPSKTIEGYPAPRRALLLAHR